MKTLSLICLHAEQHGIFFPDWVFVSASCLSHAFV